MFADASALVIALIASLVAARPANERNTYGYQRAEVFGALINAVLLIALCVWIAIEAIGRLVTPSEHEVAGGLMLAVAVTGLVANAISMWLLSAAQRTPINVRGAYLEVLGDLIGSAVVIVAAIVIWTTGWMPADALASLLIAVMIVPRAITLLREVFAVLGERAPEGTDVATIREHILSADGVADVHDVHVWQLTRGAPSSRRTSSSSPTCSRAVGRARCCRVCNPVSQSTSTSSTRRSSSSPPGTRSTRRTDAAHRSYATMQRMTSPRTNSRHSGARLRTRRRHP
jgi:cation diffusion facilitator family transporter